MPSSLNILNLTLIGVLVAAALLVATRDPSTGAEALDLATLIR